MWLVAAAWSLAAGTSCDAFAVVEIASGLFQEPVTDAAVDLRQGQATAVGTRGKNPHGVARAGSPLASAPTPG